MRNILILVLICWIGFPVAGQAQQNLKVFISVDMEGIAGAVDADDVRRSGKDYDHFRRIMAGEANAAIEGALAAGATEILLRDSHGAKNNLLPSLLNKNAKLLRGRSSGPKNMMEAIDESFHAVVFIGYHAKAGTPDAILEHTSSGNVTDISINGVSLPEAGYNALIAGLHNVPVVFLAGDRAVCEQNKALFGEVETVAVKEAVDTATISLHPEVAVDRIRAGVQKALSNLGRYKPFKLSPPYTMVLKLKNESSVYDASLYPGTKRTGEWEVTYTNDDLLDVLNAFNQMK
jgi:D-amino peptidase